MQVACLLAVFTCWKVSWAAVAHAPLPSAELAPPLLRRLPQALGVAASPEAAVATSAAIKWITKDGLGAAGRLIVGGNLAQGGCAS